MVLKQKVLLKTGNLKVSFLVKKTDQIKVESILPSYVDAPVKKGQKDWRNSDIWSMGKVKRAYTCLHKTEHKTERLLVLF